jgi:hypothetical protein
MTTDNKSMVVDPDKGYIGITVFFNKDEGWINVLTCEVGTSVSNLRPISVEVLPYTATALQQWIVRAEREPNSVYIFGCKRIP